MDVNITIKVPEYVISILTEAGLSTKEIPEAFKEFIQWSLDSRTVYSEAESDFLDWWDEEKEFYDLSED